MEIGVIDVLKGNLNESRVSFVALPPTGFEEGQELVICSRWFQGRKMSAFVTNTLIGLYAQVDTGAWERCVDDFSRVPKERLTQEQLLSRVDQASLRSMTTASDVVARGEIVAKWESSYRLSDGRVGELTHYRLQVSELGKGEVTSGALEFVIPKINLSYVPNWYREVAPGIAEGQEWLVFLKNGERGLYPFGGPNSLLKVEGHTLLYDMAVIYPADIEEVSRKVRQEVTNAE